jgi:predicted AlkP superfamily pyrophosphatase or phosphodiesterase
VVIISVDGLRPDAIVRAPARNLLAAASKGAYSWRAQTISPSITLPSHSSMLSGFLPADHGIYYNDVRPGYIPVPTVMSLAKREGLRTVVVVGKEKMFTLTPPGAFDVYVWATGGDADVAAKAIEEAGKGFDMMFVHFPSVDLTGHVLQWMSEAYLNQVAETDGHLGRLFEALGPDTTVILSADHGGHGYGHHLGTPVDSTIPWLAFGPRIRRGHAIGAEISTVDTAATAAHLLGLRLASGAKGEVVQDALMP